MTFKKSIALIAILGLAAQANAFTGGGLRRTETVAQIETTPVAAPADVAIETKTTETKTVETKAVEVAPVAVETKAVATPVEVEALTKAEQLRKSRVNEEVQTENKIVEKLEAARLAEEQARAEKLFSEKTAADKSALPAAPIAAPVAAPVAPAPSITIEKVEIIQPTAVRAEVAPVAAPPAVVAEAEIVEAPVAPKRTFYVGGLLAAPNYDSSRVKSNFGLGATIGLMLNDDFVVEGSFTFSNYYVNNVWQQPLFREMDQYEAQVAVKYYLLNGIVTGRLKPYVGASGSFIYREYTDRQLQLWSYNSSRTTQDTNSVNIGAMVGADFAINGRLSIGGLVEYSQPIMSKNEFDLSMYGINNGQTKVEDWHFTTLKLTAKFSF